MTNDLYPMPRLLPVKRKPLHGAEARQLATWLERYANRKPVCPLAPSATKYLRGVRRGRWPLDAGRFYAIWHYVQRMKALKDPTPMTLTLGSDGIGVNWGVSPAQMGEAERWAGHPLPLVSPKNFRS